MRIIFLGPPGAGKGTYSSKIGQILGIPHISTGAIFREAVELRTEVGKSVSEYLKRGELVPDGITINILKTRIDQPDCINGFILDGYPRTTPQAEALDRAVNINVVFNLKINETVLVRKIFARRICKVCGEIYNVASIKETIDGVKYDMAPMLPKISGICDNCGSKLVQRKDDTIDIINKRLKVYRIQTEPLIKYYESKCLLKEILVNAGPEVMVPKIIAKIELLKAF